MFEEQEKQKKTKTVKKITAQRLKNIALYYLKRFDTTSANLRQVLLKRVKEYKYYYPDYDMAEALGWIEQIVSDFERYGYLDDVRYAENKCRDYIAAGKPKRYIVNKLKENGVAPELIEECFETQEYDPFEVALHFARKKKIGCYRADAEQRLELRQKDMGTLVRAGFDYDTVLSVLDYDVESAE